MKCTYLPTVVTVICHNVC